MVAAAVEQPRILSTVTIGDDDRVVNVLRIHIEEGGQQLFILAVADRPVIFSVFGAVARVERFVTLGSVAVRNAPMIGVAGIAAEKVTPIAATDWAVEERVRADMKRGIIYEHYRPAYCAPSAGWVLNAKQNGRLDNLFPKLSRKINQVVGSTFATDVFLPSGRTEGNSTERIPYPPPSSDFRQQIEAEMQQEWPGGIQSLEAGSVLSALPVKAYDVLPAGAGMLQLIDRGVLRPVGNQAVTIIGLEKAPEGGLIIPNDPKVSSVSRPRAYRIEKPMRFPAELDGRWDFTFCLPAGMTLPTGKPGASTVILEDGGAVAVDRGQPSGVGSRPELCKRE